MADPTSRALRSSPRHMQVNLQRLDDGRFRVSTPQARGWAMVGRGPMQLWHAVQVAWVEAAKAGQARWHGTRTDLDLLTEHDDPTEPAPRRLPNADELEYRAEKRHQVSYSAFSIVRPDQANPADWSPNEPEPCTACSARGCAACTDGYRRSWTSPNGRRWYAQRTLGPLLAKRLLMGLPTTFEEYQAAQGQTQGATA